MQSRHLACYFHACRKAPSSPQYVGDQFNIGKFVQRLKEIIDKKEYEKFRKERKMTS